MQLTIYHQYQCLKFYNTTLSIGKTSNDVAINSEATVTTEPANEISAGVSSSRRVTFEEPTVKRGNEEAKAGTTFVKRGNEEVKAGASFVTPPPPVVNKRRSETTTSAEPRASPSNHVKETLTSSSNHVKETPSILDVFDDADDDTVDDKNSDGEDPHDSSEDDNMGFAIKVACDSSSSSDDSSIDEDLVIVEKPQPKPPRSHPQPKPPRSHPRLAPKLPLRMTSESTSTMVTTRHGKGIVKQSTKPSSKAELSEAKFSLNQRIALARDAVLKYWVEVRKPMCDLDDLERCRLYGSRQRTNIPAISERRNMIRL